MRGFVCTEDHTNDNFRGGYAVILQAQKEVFLLLT